MRILVTGATGFVGGALVHRLASDPRFRTRAAVRLDDSSLPPGVERARVASVGAHSDWREALSGVDVVVHAAARVHVMRERDADTLGEFRRVNTAGSLNLARQAAIAGVRRFVFISSIKVNGESTPIDRPYTADDTPAPADPYGVSKHEAEQGLHELARLTGLEVVIIRPVLVYGPGVKANFRSMLVWLHRGIPLPLGALSNRRSLVALDNLVDLVFRCITHPAAANETFLVSDGEDLSTSDLLKRAARALGTSARLVPVPAAILMVATRLLGKGSVGDRLCGSLCVDITKTCALLGWSPPVDVDAALASTGAYFLEHQAE